MDRRRRFSDQPAPSCAHAPATDEQALLNNRLKRTKWRFLEGGGYDQGELMVDAVLGEQFHWIAPSRFGYLRSTFRDGATFDDQAHAYAALLDHLGVKRVAAVALSQSGPSALLFAVLHPERVSSLTLISCGIEQATIRSAVQQHILDNVSELHIESP